MPERKYSKDEKYKYGFNGKENDNDVMGEGNQQDYGMRIYDPRVGRFLSVDPLKRDFPWNSSYAFAENDIIRSIDLDGLEKYIVTYWYEKDGNHMRTTIKTIRDRDSKEIMDLNFMSATGDDLTNEQVWVRHLYLNGTKKQQSFAKNGLNKSESRLFKRAKTRRDPQNWQINYNFGDQTGGKTIESELFPGDKFEYREATRKVIQDLTPDIDFDDFIVLATTPDAGGGANKNGDIDWNTKDGIALKTLINDIKEDGEIKSINIEGIFSVGESSPDQVKEFKRGIELVKNALTSELIKSGIKKEDIRIDLTTTTKRENQKAITIELKR